jgi:hypothetical protein
MHSGREIWLEFDKDQWAKAERVVKAKGRCSCETSPSLSDLSKIWFGTQIATASSRSCLKNASGARASLTSRYQRRKSFIASIFPVAWREARCRPSQMSAVHSLLLEDCSSVERNSTPHPREIYGAFKINRCGKAVPNVDPVAPSIDSRSSFSARPARVFATIAHWARARRWSADNFRKLV